MLRGLIEQSGCEVITRVTTFADHGVHDPRYGLVLHTIAGTRLWLHSVRTSPNGGDDSTAPERIVEADLSLDPVPVSEPNLRADGRIQLSEVTSWLQALLINSGSRELSSVMLISDRPGEHHTQGLHLKFHSGATVTCMWRYTVPAGSEPPTEPFDVSEVV
jgi:hypothetical protein